MKTTARNKSDRTLASEERKVLAGFPALARSYGMTEDGDGWWVGWSYRFGCAFRAKPDTEMEGHPSLYGRFVRDYRRPNLPWDHPQNVQTYRDIENVLGRGRVNNHSGKFNLLIFEREKADQILYWHGMHLQEALGTEDDEL